MPQRTFERFTWQEAFSFLRPAEIRAQRVFAFNSRHVVGYSGANTNYRGMGFFLDQNGHRVASPVTRLDFTLTPRGATPERRGRLVMLNFEPQPGYWSSAAGRDLLAEMASYAALAPVSVWVEIPKASLWPDEVAEVIVRGRDLRFTPGTHYEVQVELRRDGQVLHAQTLSASGEILSVPLHFPMATEPGLYEVRATYQDAGRPIEIYETGFWRRDTMLLTQGPRFTAGRTYLRKDGASFLPVGVNHYSNDPVWGNFPRTSNGLVWDRDFAAMQARHLTFVRTGIWDNRLYYTDVVSGAASEPVLRNIESLLHAAGRHDLNVQFTFLPAFGAIPLPPPGKLRVSRQVVGQQVRAFDYNLFAQDMFTGWLSAMVAAIRETGSRQLVTVGHDEGGITDRVLNQFYAGAGIDLTAVHAWWYDDALLWTGLAAKVPGRPNFIGEVGPQPAYTLDGQSRWDETQGLALAERKLSLGLGAGNAGAAY